jgi:CO/xanthine dehydrogenase Mo-binding subunit
MLGCSATWAQLGCSATWAQLGCSATWAQLGCSATWAQLPDGPAPPADLDNFLAVQPNGSVTIFTSHVDPGTGLTAAYRQIAAEELGIPVERFAVVQGDMATTPDHGGTGGSSGVPRGGAGGLPGCLLRE